MIFNKIRGLPTYFQALICLKCIENDDLTSFELLISSLYVSGMKTVAKCP